MYNRQDSFENTKRRSDGYLLYIYMITVKYFFRKQEPFDALQGLIPNISMKGEAM